MAKKAVEQNKIVKFGKQSVGDLAKRVPTAGRFQLWKALFSQGMSGMFRMNLISVVCFLPVVYLLFQIMAQSMSASSTIPFTSFLGIGYPAVVDASEIAFVTSQAVFYNLGVMLLPIAIVLSGFLSLTTQYSMRNFVWTEGDFKFKKLFKGFKFHTVKFAIISVITGALSMGLLFIVYLLRNAVFYQGWSFLNIMMLISLVIVGLILIIATLYAYSIAVTYKDNVLNIYRDAFILTFKVILQNIAMVVVMFAPLAVFFFTIGTFFFSLIVVAFLFIGFSYMMLTWTVYSQYVFDIVTFKIK